MGLEKCGAAAASGDGREVFTLQAGGQLVNVAGGKCASVRESSGEDGDVVLGNCDNAAECEIGGNAQLKLVGAPKSTEGPAHIHCPSQGKRAGSPQKASGTSHGGRGETI